MLATHSLRTKARIVLLIDVIAGIRLLLIGSTNVGRLFPISEISGGQWPQVRKAKLKSFEGHNLCPLCHAAPGTLLHRHCCMATMPDDGWQAPKPLVKTFIGTIGACREDTLRTRAVLALAVPILEKQPPSDGWLWHTSPPDPDREDLTWVMDGSRKLASCYASV